MPLEIDDFGHSITIAGALFSDGEGNAHLINLPGENISVFTNHRLNEADWRTVLRQVDMMPIEALTTEGKAIVRKCERQIDQNTAWAVYKRDGYACRYCNRDDVPLTVDHLVLWEHGGPTIEENLLSACRRCNKLRGNMEYDDWLDSDKYRKVSGKLTEAQVADNILVVDTLSNIQRSPIKKKR